MIIQDEANIGLTIKNTVVMMQKVFDFDLRKNVGISLSHAKVIRTLLLQDGLTQKEIAESISIEAPTLVPMIDKMEREGLVQRRQDETDRRNKRVYLTSKSRLLRDDIDQSISRIQKIACKGIVKGDLEKTLKVLDAIAKNASDYLEACTCSAEPAKVTRT